MGTDGSLLAGSRMGRVMWRRAGASGWTRLQIDTWKEVLSVRQFLAQHTYGVYTFQLRYRSIEGALVERRGTLNLLY